MPGIVPTKLSKLLPVIQLRLMTALEWPEERVLLALKDPTTHPHERYLRLWPRQSVSYQIYRHGAGRVDTRVTRRLAVKLCTRLALDSVTSSKQWLTHETLGHLDTEHAIIDALENFQPLDGDQNWLVYQPMKLQPVSEPDLEPEEPEWGCTVQEYDLSFVLQLNQDYQ